MSACMSLTCFDNKCGHGAPTGLHLYRETSPVFSGSVLAMTRMPPTEENEMFIKHQYSGVCLSSDFTMTYYACTPDYCCIFTYMNL